MIRFNTESHTGMKAAGLFSHSAIYQCEVSPEKVALPQGNHKIPTSNPSMQKIYLFHTQCDLISVYLIEAQTESQVKAEESETESFFFFF